MAMEMRTEGPVKTRREGAILEVTLDAPKANAISLKTSRVMGLASYFPCHTGSRFSAKARAPSS